MDILNIVDEKNLRLVSSVAFGLKELENAAEKKNIKLSVTLAKNDFADNGEKLSEQGYAVSEITENSIKITGGGESGLMYALLDISHHIKYNGNTSGIKEKHQEPYIEKRGIKFNAPLDARTPSYSDSGDSAQNNIENMWDFEFWKHFLDNMAKYKYNAISLWNLHPFPSMVKVPGYEDVALNDVMRTTYPYKGYLNGAGFMSEQIAKSCIVVKKMTIDEKISFWQKVMEYAKERCISVYIFTWNIFNYGTEHTSYGIDCSSTNEVTKDYYRKSVKEMLKTYPLLAGIGITPGEQMSHRKDMYGDIAWLMETYGRGIMDALSNDKERDFTLIHRLSPFDFFVAGGDTQEKDDSKIDDGQRTALKQMQDIFKDFPYNFELSFKYSQAHMYANDKPMFGDVFFPMIKNGPKTWLTVRNDDFYLLRWGDPEFARRYLKNIPTDVTIGYFMGPDGYIWGKEYSEKNSAEPEMFIDKMWYMFLIWGELSYQNDLPKEHFEECLKLKFAEKIGAKLFEAIKLSSEAIPKFQSMCFRTLDFHWYPEACCSYLANEDGVVLFRDINSFIDCPAATRSEFVSIRDYCEATAENRKIDGILPPTIINDIKNSCKVAFKLCEELEGELDSDEYRETVTDIEAMSSLGMYYALKSEAAISLCMYRITGDTQEKEKAVSLITEAYDLWLKYSSLMERFSAQRLTRYKTFISPSLFNGDAKLDIDIAKQ